MALVSSGLLAACSTLLGEGFSGGGRGADDGLVDGGDVDSTDGLVDEAAVGSTDGATDQPTDPGASDAAGAPENVLTNGDFELGCAGWNVTYGSLAESDVSRSGSRSCRVCGIDFYASARITIMPGEQYVAETWIRSAPDAAISGPVKFQIHSGHDDGSMTTGPVPSNDWQRVTAVLSVTKSDDHLNVNHHISSSGECYLVDDVSLRRME